jgi:translation initiation factor 2 subunit 3
LAKLKLPKQPEINIGTAGHVDHGKTTLVEGITGVWTSAHSEELRRGITIRVGYADAAFYKCKNCPSPDCYTTKPTCPICGGEAELLRVVSFVDCPGHESLMANMLSGAALMDGAILVIAADQKVPQPQTREHLLALQMLGAKNIVIAQNKLDLITDNEAWENYSQIKEFIKGTVANGAPIIPISAQHRVNIDALIQAIEERIPTPKRDPNKPPLLQTLRSFDVNKPGIRPEELRGGVIGGALQQGILRIEDEVEIRPGIPDAKTQKYVPVRTKIVSLGTSAGLVNEVKPGGLVAVGTLLDPYYTKSDALAGSVLGIPEGLPPVLSSFQMETYLFEHAVGTPELVKVEPVRINEPLRLNVGTAVTLGVVTKAKKDFVEVQLRRPVCASIGSRVAISRRIGDRWRLIGSGIIT